MKMKRFSEILKAPLRYRTSKGFGVHSPFAYSFILNVLKQPYAYYSYTVQQRRYRKIKQMGHTMNLPGQKIPPLVFRVVNRFRPVAVFQFGCRSELLTAAVLDASEKLVVVEYATRFGIDALCAVSGAESCKRVERFESMLPAVEKFNALCGNTIPFLLIDCVGADESGETERFLNYFVKKDFVAVFTDISSSNTTKQMWIKLNKAMTDHGMTFTNGRTGIITGLNRLPRQTFNIWI